MGSVAHPLASQAWRQLRDRSESDRRLVFDALQRRLEVGATTVKQEQALYALGQWMHLKQTKEAPSRRAYDAFRAAQPNPLDWPSPTLIRNAFGGSWAAATAAVEGRPEANVLARRKTTRGKKFEPELVKKLLLAWIETLPPEEPLRQVAFIGWCLEEAAKTDSKFKHVPRTSNSVKVALGGWEKALASVGALERHPAQAMRLRSETQAKKAIKSRLSLSRAPRQKSEQGRFEDDELIAWLRWGQKQLKVSAPISEEHYAEVRRRVLEATRRRGEVLRIPSQATIAGRFRSWAGALESAGLTDPNSPGAHDRRPYSDDEIRQALLEAKAATDGPLSESAYRAWRTAELKRHQRNDPAARLPHALSLKNRFGGAHHSWDEVLARVLSQGIGE